MTFSGVARGHTYTEKTRVELARLEEEGVVMTGNAFSSVLLVKGSPGNAERTGNDLLSGADGKALRAALLALGYAPEDWAALATWRRDGTPLDARLMRECMVVVDPSTLIVCDETAVACLRDTLAQDLLDMENFEDALLAPGRVVRVAGMRVMALGGFEDALTDDHQKQVMWARLKQIPPLGEPY